MKCLLATGFALGAVVLCVHAGTAQPLQGPEGKLRNQQGPPRRRGEGPPPGPPRWQLGKVIPQHICDELGLSADQEKQLHDLEREVKDRVMHLLTENQKHKLERLQDRMGPPPGRRGGPPNGRRDRQGEPPDGPRDGRREPPDGPPPPPEPPGPPPDDGQAGLP